VAEADVRAQAARQADAVAAPVVLPFDAVTAETLFNNSSRTVALLLLGLDSLPTTVCSLAELRILCRQMLAALPNFGFSTNKNGEPCRNQARPSVFIFLCVELRQSCRDLFCFQQRFCLRRLESKATALLSKRELRFYHDATWTLCRAGKNNDE
jgi:hypothetical protein